MTSADRPYFIIHRWTTLAGKLEKQYSFGQLVSFFLTLVLALLLWALWAQN